MSKFCLQKPGAAISRREFLNRGATFAGGIVLAPTLYGLVSGAAAAHAEGDAIILGLTVGFRGGNHFHASVKHLLLSGAEQASYSQQRPLSSGAVDFGGAKVWTGSPLHAQLVAPLTAANASPAQALVASRTALGSLLGRTNDDGGNFRVATRQYAQIATARARTLLPGISNGIGGASYLDAANGQLAAFAPVPISQLANYQGLFSWDSGILRTTQISSQGMQEAMRLAAGRSTRAVLELIIQGVRGSDTVRTAAEKSFPEVVGRFASQSPPNPVNDPDFANWFTNPLTDFRPAAANPNVNNDDAKQALILACIVQAAKAGQIAAGHWNLQGYDLHGRGQAYATRDTATFAQLRCAMETLATAGTRLGKRVLFQAYLTSDGAHAMAPNNGAANDLARGNHPTGDTGEIASHLCFMMDTSALPAVGRNQIGQYNSSQRVDLSVTDASALLVGNSPDNQAAASAANFAKLLGLNARDFFADNLAGATFINPG